MHRSVDILANKKWWAGLVALLAIAGFVFAPALNKKLARKSAEGKCMRVLEAAAQAARTKSGEEHATIILKAMATPECKAVNDLARAGQDRPIK